MDSTTVNSKKETIKDYLKDIGVGGRMEIINHIWKHYAHCPTKLQRYIPEGVLEGFRFGDVVVDTKYGSLADVVGQFDEGIMVMFEDSSSFLSVHYDSPLFNRLERRR